MTDDPNKVGIDAPPVLPSTAVLLVVHHLQLAATYWEAVGDERQHTLLLLIRTLPDLHRDPALAWLRMIEAEYATLDDVDGSAND